MHKAVILKEMGISSWKVRELRPQSQDPIPQPIMSQPMNPQFPIWTLVLNANPATHGLLKNIQKVIQNFGVEVQFVTEPPSNLSSQDIRGQLLIAFGEIAGAHFSQESAPLAELREILFETINEQDQEIPVVITYPLEELLQDPVKKKWLWADLVFARNVFVDTMAS